MRPYVKLLNINIFHIKTCVYFEKLMFDMKPVDVIVFLFLFKICILVYILFRVYLLHHQMIIIDMYFFTLL